MEGNGPIGDTERRRHVGRSCRGAWNDGGEFRSRWLTYRPAPFLHATFRFAKHAGAWNKGCEVPTRSHIRGDARNGEMARYSNFPKLHSDMAGCRLVEEASLARRFCLRRVVLLRPRATGSRRGDTILTRFMHTTARFTPITIWPPDQVVANVQATLQELGYYQGPINGVLGFSHPCGYSQLPARSRALHDIGNRRANIGITRNG